MRWLCLSGFCLLFAVGCGPGPALATAEEADADTASDPLPEDVVDAGMRPEPDYTAEVLQYNVGNGAARAGQQDVIQWLEEGQTPTVITLNELCGVRYQQIEEVASTRGYSSAFFATNPDGCGGSNGGLGYGNAIFVRGTLTEPATGHIYENQEPNAEARTLGCVRFSVGFDDEVAACVTHLENNDTYARLQAGEALAMASALRLEVGGGRVVVGGDFNLQPQDPAIVTWRDSAFDAAGTDLATYENGKTIDYIFATRSADTNEARTEVGVSDHYALRSTIWNY